jgi:hypothetical protein
MDKNKVRASSYIQMEIFIRATFKKILDMAKARCFSKMGEYTEVNGKMTVLVEKVF